MTIYNIKYTDVTKNPITVDETDQNDTDIDVTLFGRVKKEYGERLNENLLHLLENFACPGIGANNPTPDTSVAFDDLLENPTDGQLWFNTTLNRPYVWSAEDLRWLPLGMRGDVQANWGKICNGEQIPQPINPITGEVYPYAYCVWVVSPSHTNEQFYNMVCTTDNDAIVEFYYENNDGVVTNGYVNYIIISVGRDYVPGLPAPF